METALQILFHSVGALQFSFSVFYDLFYVDVPDEMMPDRPSFGGKFIYLTFWDAVIQSIFFSMCLINDIFGTNDPSPEIVPGIRKAKDILFVSIAFPLSCFVAATFWGLYFFDRELVLPKVLDLYFPTWLNHIMHTNIFIFTLVELLINFREYPSRRQGLSILSTFMLAYLAWTFVIFIKSGNWVYPVLKVLNWPERIAFFALSLLLAQSFFLFGQILNDSYWKNFVQKSNSLKKKKK